jgi:hypothetical protein
VVIVIRNPQIWSVVQAYSEMIDRGGFEKLSTPVIAREVSTNSCRTQENRLGRHVLGSWPQPLADVRIASKCSLGVFQFPRDSRVEEPRSFSPDFHPKTDLSR